MTRNADRPEPLGPAIAAFGGPHALSPAMALWSIPITVFSIVWVGWAVAGPSPWWFVIAAAVQLEMVVLGLAARPVLLPLLRAKPRPLLMLVFFSLLGWLRGSTSSALVLWLELQPVEQVGFRPIGGPIITVVTVFLVAWAIDGNRRHRQLMVELRGIGEALTTSREHLGDLLREERHRILGDVDAMVTGPVADLRPLIAQGPDAAADAVARINGLIDDTVKPLSRQLGQEFQPWAPVAVAPAEEHWISRVRGIAVRRPLAPALHAVTMTLMLPTVLAAEMPFVTALVVGLFAGAGVWALLAATDWLRGRLLGPRGPLGSAGLVALASAIATLPVLAGMAVSIPADRQVHTYQISAIGAMLVIGLGVLIINITQQLRTEAEEQLRTSNAELAVEVARVSGQLWVQQNRIAQLLHGPVQGALIVAVARLMAAARDDAPMPSAAELLDPIDEALAEVDAASTAAPAPAADLGVFFGQLSRVWSGAMQVQTRLPDSVGRVLAGSPTTTSLLTAIVPELVNNAYRHGGSSHVQVALELLEPEIVRLQVFSNGPGPSAAAAPGLGSQLLDATALAWRRSFGPAGVDVIADFPLAASGAVAASELPKR